MCISKSRPPEQETLAADSTQTKGELLSEENQSAVPVEANSEKSFGPAGSSDPESAGQRFRELITCKCGKKHKLDSSFLGKKVRCKHSKRTTAVGGSAAFAGRSPQACGRTCYSRGWSISRRQSCFGTKVGIVCGYVASTGATHIRCRERKRTRRRGR
jgi:hypothetical protein